MKTSEMLCAIASWLESPDNEAILLSEENKESLRIVATSCVIAGNMLRTAAEKIANLEPAQPKITVDSIDRLANLASILDSSNHPELKRQASAIDELLLTVAAPENSMSVIKQLEKNRTEELKRRFIDSKKKIEDNNKVGETEKAIEQNGMTKTFRQMEFPLSTRYCPDHPGVQIARVGDNMWQCELDKKVYNYSSGFELMNGDKVPGGVVECADDSVNASYYSVFDTRNERLQTNKP